MKKVVELALMTALFALTSVFSGNRHRRPGAERHRTAGAARRLATCSAVVRDEDLP